MNRNLSWLIEGTTETLHTDALFSLKCDGYILILDRFIGISITTVLSVIV